MYFTEKAKNNIIQLWILHTVPQMSFRCSPTFTDHRAEKIEISFFLVICHDNCYFKIYLFWIWYHLFLLTRAFTNCPFKHRSLFHLSLTVVLPLLSPPLTAESVDTKVNFNNLLMMYQEQGSSPDSSEEEGNGLSMLPHLADLVSYSIQKVIGFAKMIPGFRCVYTHICACVSENFPVPLSALVRYNFFRNNQDGIKTSLCKSEASF